MSGLTRFSDSPSTVRDRSDDRSEPDEISAGSNEGSISGPDPSLLIVDDDGPFLRRLARAMEARGFACGNGRNRWRKVWPKSKGRPPKYAVVDLRLGDGNGLDVIEAIRQRRDDTQIIVLTGYGNIATAVTRREARGCGLPGETC